MWKFLNSLLGDGVPRQKPVPSSEKATPAATAYTTRLGKTVPVDDAFRAWTSGDLDAMLKALHVKTNLIDRHFLLMGIVDATYKKRSDEKMGSLCASVAQIHLSEFSAIAPALKEDIGGFLPRVTTFQLYATLLSEQGEFEEAITVCKSAIAYGLHDNTQSGFEERIELIKKQWAKHNGI